jgi:hypothetical protein
MTIKTDNIAARVEAASERVEKNTIPDANGIIARVTRAPPRPEDIIGADAMMTVKGASSVWLPPPMRLLLGPVLIDLFPRTSQRPMETGQTRLK